MVKYSLAALVLAFALSGQQQTTAFQSLSQKKTAFTRKTSLNTLPDYLELPSGGAPPPPPAVVEAISAVTKAAPPAPKIAESVTSSLPAVPDVSLPSVSLPDISDITSGLDMGGMLPIVGLLAFAAVVGVVATSGEKSPAPSAPSIPDEPVVAPSSSVASVVEEIVSIPVEEEIVATPVEEVSVVDISVPFDAPAKMAYEAAGSKGDYAKFKEDYETKAVKDVIKKQKKEKE